MVDIQRTPPSQKRRNAAIGVGLLAIIMAGAALTRLDPAAPSIDLASVTIDTVRRGDMVREVRGPGTLVPEHVRWIPAVNSARVDRIVAQVGQAVTPESVLLEMSNPDVDIQAMQAEQAASAARVALGTLRVALQTGILNQRNAVAAAKTAMITAMQDATAAEQMIKGRLISTFEYNTRKAAAEEAVTRHEVAVQQAELLNASIDSQLRAQQEDVQRLRQIAAYRESLKASLTLRAGDSGILQELSTSGGTPLEPGQWVNQGQSIAKIVQPGKLKAVVRVPETQAKDLRVGQDAVVDTRNGLVKGRVAHIALAATGGTVTVDLELTGALPSGARPDLNVDATIRTQVLKNVVFAGRPSSGQGGQAVAVYRLDDNGTSAARVRIRLGVMSMNAAQIVAGLKPGDRIILSDVTQANEAERVRLR